MILHPGKVNYKHSQILVLQHLVFTYSPHHCLLDFERYFFSRECLLRFRFHDLKANKVSSDAMRVDKGRVQKIKMEI